jgi:hypothetical protein
MPALLPIFLTATQVVLAADAVPKFDVGQTCRRAADVAASLGRTVGDCQRDEDNARGRLEQEWTQYSATHRTDCVRFSSRGTSPSYVELLTCLEMAKQASELPESSRMGTSGQR